MANTTGKANISGKYLLMLEGAREEHTDKKIHT